MHMCRCLVNLEGVGQELGGPTTRCYHRRGQWLQILPGGGGRGMDGQLGAVLLENVGIDVKAEVDPEEEFHLEAVHLRYQDAADLGVVGVVVVGIVEELGGQQDGRYDHSMNVEVGKEKVVPLDETVDVDQSQDEAFGGARGIFVDTAVMRRNQEANVGIEKVRGDIAYKSTIKRYHKQVM